MASRTYLSKQDGRGSSLDAETDETSILAAVGSRATPMASYETSVIREATLQSAPDLTGVGLPDLAPLGPSYDARRRVSSGASDAPTVRTILSRVRSQVREHHERNGIESHASLLLRIKEQMLLTYLHKVSRLSPEDMPIDPMQEETSELKRARQFTFTTEPSNGAPESSQGASATDMEGPSRKRRALSHPSSQSAAERLEAIKQDGTLARSVISASSTSSFGKQALAEQHQTRTARTRTTMMHRKRATTGGQSPLDDEQTERNELLRKKRKEQQELRRRRREQFVESSDEDEEENELMLDDDNENCMNDQLEPSEDDSGHGSCMSCPLCKVDIPVGPGADGDAILSKHIDQCQRHSRRSRRRRRRQPSQSSERGDDEMANMSTSSSNELKTRHEMVNSKGQRRHAVFISSKRSIDDIQECDYEDRVDEWIESGIQRMREMDERDQNEIPPGAVEYDGGLVVPAWVNNKLFPYQRTGLRWMWELYTQEAGGVVGDEMGLGKTVQVCSFLGAMALARKLRSVLVVCPATMLQHWLSELSIWAPGLRRVLAHQSGEVDGLSRSITPELLRSLSKWLRCARADRVNEPIDERDLENLDEDSFCGTGYVVITTFESVRRSPDVWTMHKWSYCVLDEGQKIRNPDADVTLACKRIRTPNRLLLSGTPIQNDLRELWSLFDFIFPGRLGTLPAFEAEFADPIRRGGYSNASPMQVQLAYRCALALRDLINPYLLRRQKKDIKEVSRMPGKTEHVLFCRLSSRQRALYESYLESETVRNLFHGSTQVLSAITVLRKICNHPDLICDPDEASFQSFIQNGCKVNTGETDHEDQEDGDEDQECDESLVERAGKFEVLAKILPLWRKQGHRVLIFCQWRKMLNIIQRFTQVQGWKFGRLDGNTNVASRQRLVDSFNSDDSYFGMLMTTRTGGIGLNLTGANRVILYDPDWNPQLDAQARERSWRFGQKNPVTVYRLITSGTIEEKIYQRQIFKTALTNAVLQDPRQRRLFSQRDLRDFFTLKPDGGSVASGGDGVTETGKITKGSGVFNPDGAAALQSSEEDLAARDNLDTLQRIMKSKGLAGIFNHDVVDGSYSNKDSRLREMEEKAKTIARQATKALSLSTAGSSAFQPTWTGSTETCGGRFGGPVRAETADSDHMDCSFGGGSAPGVKIGGNSRAMSSGSLISSLKRRRDPAKPSGISNSDLTQYSDLLCRLRTFLQRSSSHRAESGPTTDDILQEFKSVPTCDAAIFRRLLNSIASVQNGRWQLKG